jgi:hypothetical protein
MKKILFSLLLLISAQAHASAPNFDFFCNQLLQKEPSLKDYSAYFTKDFQKAVPLEYLKAIFSDLYGDTGQCVSYKALPSGQGKYRLTLSGDKKIDALFSATFDEASGLFSGLLLNGINAPSFQVQSWADVEAGLQKLDPHGKLSATLKTNDGTVNLSHNLSEVFAIGSTFKLYILGALEQAISRGEHSWDEILPLNKEWKSLPSGIMQDWPAGKQVKLYDYAQNMISLSDNTATDHLLYLLGRNTVQNMLTPMGNAHEQLFAPFLSTLEMFKLKWAINPTETQNYIQQNEAGRLNILNSLVQVPRSQVGTNGVSLDKPTLISQLEWFATTPENCEAMFWLADQNNQQVRSILSKNVPIIDLASPNSHWAYAGFKGGSEPGVLSMTFLLESKKGNRACFAMSWNNESEAVSQNRFMDIVGKALKFAETKIP